MDWFGWPAAAIAAGAAGLVPLGRGVLQRGVVFMDLAVAQAAAAAAMIALAGGLHSPWLEAAGMVGALVCAAAVAAIERHAPAHREACIGLLYVACSSAALMAASLNPHGREHLLQLLAADVLWAQAIPVGALAVGAAGCGLLHRWGPPVLRGSLGFYLSFAIVVSLAVPVLGLFVVFALLIGPGLATAAVGSPPHGMRWAVAVGALAGWAGLALSWGADLPSGPSVAATCAAVGLIPLMTGVFRLSR